MPDPPSVKPVRIFWSYSHKDEELRNKLESHLAALKREKRVEAWHDRKIPAGANWRDAIDRELDSSDLILILVSANFIHSEFCHSVELARAIDRHNRSEALVIPIMLRPCDVKGTSIESLQQLPFEGRPITKWRNRDEACEDVARRLRIAIEEWTGRNVTQAPQPSQSGMRVVSPSAGAPSAKVQPERPASVDPVLHKIFGFGGAVSAGWLRRLLALGTGVARVETLSGEAVGSGFLVDPIAFGLEPSRAPLLLSCSFVITPENLPGSHEGLTPDDTVIRFEMVDVVRRVKAVVWSSPVEQLRSVLVTLDGPVPVEPLPMRSERLTLPILRETGLVVIAHPAGGGLKFSLQDARLLDADETRVQYRAATAGGSSGGVVLDTADLSALAIHTSRNPRMPRLHGAGFYEACEGISLFAIQDAVRGRSVNLE